MLRTNASLAKLGLKSSIQMEGNNRSFREGRESETSELHDGTQSVLRRLNSPSRPNHELTATNRLSRRSAHQPRTSNTPVCLAPQLNHLERVVSQLKEEYAQDARLSRYSQLVKAKS